MGEMVEFPVNGHSAGGYLAVPASGSGAGVIVLQEWWGLVPQIKAVCDRLAEAGFTALTYDYRGIAASAGNRKRWRSLRMKDWALLDFPGLNLPAGNEGSLPATAGAVTEQQSVSRGGGAEVVGPGADHFESLLIRTQLALDEQRLAAALAAIGGMNMTEMSNVPAASLAVA